MQLKFWLSFYSPLSRVFHFISESQNPRWLDPSRLCIDVSSLLDQISEVIQQVRLGYLGKSTVTDLKEKFESLMKLQNEEKITLFRAYY
jgi:hypothetical protein